MKTYKSTLFTGVISDCTEYVNIDDFKLLPEIYPSNNLINIYLKGIGNAFSRRKSDITDRMINELNMYSIDTGLTFNVDELENGELFIKIDDINYIFDVCYLRIIIPVEYVTDYEIKEN